MGIKSKDKGCRDKRSNNNNDDKSSPSASCSASAAMIHGPQSLMVTTDAVNPGGDVGVQTGSPAPGSPTGYNSGDEYPSVSKESRPCWTPEQVIDMERRFEKVMRKKGYLLMKMGDDGACLFRAVADQVYADEEMHSLVRRLCCDYMTKNSDYFSQYVTEDFNQYVMRKRREHIQGNHVELQALSELFGRPIEVYHYSSEPINIFQSGSEFEEPNNLPLEVQEPIRISYHTPGVVDCGHYNSVRPSRPGMFKPKVCPLIHFTPPQVVETAMRNSEADALEKAMLEDKIRATDWEATNEALEEQVARESYLEWVRETEKRRKRSRHGHGSRDLDHSVASSSTVTNTLAVDSSQGMLPKAGGSRGTSPQSFFDNNEGSRRHRHFAEEEEEDKSREGGHSKTGPRSPSALYYQEVPTEPETEREILARVLLASRQEYLDSLKARKRASPSPNQGSRSPKQANRGSTPPPSSSRMSWRRQPPCIRLTTIQWNIPLNILNFKMDFQVKFQCIHEEYPRTYIK